jgi:hypothetical protein
MGRRARLALAFGLLCLLVHPVNAGETRNDAVFSTKHAVFSLAQARGRLFAGSRTGEIGVFSRWSRAQREARAMERKNETAEQDTRASLPAATPFPLQQVRSLPEASKF